MSNQIRFLDTETEELGEKLIRGEEVTLSDGSALLMGTNDFVLVPEEDEVAEEAEARANADYKLQTQINEVKATAETAKSIAKGANQAISYGNYETMITAFNAITADAYKVGQNVMIVTLNVPDLWVSEVVATAVTYTYVDDDTFVSTLKNDGYVQVGYYKLSALETQKVDLDRYVAQEDFEQVLGSVQTAVTNNETEIARIDAELENCATKEELPASRVSIEAYFSITEANTTINLEGLVGVSKIDWGDGTIDKNLTHTYAEAVKEEGDTYNILVYDCTEIGNKTFAENKYLTYININPPVSQQMVPDFNNCTALEMVIINTRMEIVVGSFMEDTALQSVSLPYGLLSLSNAAFQNCSSLTDIIIPDTVENISIGTFSGCSSLKSITLGERIKYLQLSPFVYCPNLTKVILKASEPPILFPDDDIFDWDVIEKIIVPPGSLNAYKNADLWKNHADKIVAFATTDEINNIVTTDTVQTISGEKFFEGMQTFNSSAYFKSDINLRGGIYATEADVPVILPEVNTDNGLIELASKQDISTLSAPDNMVTTDTEQDITAYKNFNDLGAANIFVDSELTSGSVITDDYRLNDGTPIVMPEAVDYEVQLAGIQDIPTNYVTTNTAQDIFGDKSFMGVVDCLGGINMREVSYEQNVVLFPDTASSGHIELAGKQDIKKLYRHQVNRISDGVEPYEINFSFISTNSTPLQAGEYQALSSSFGYSGKMEKVSESTGETVQSFCIHGEYETDAAYISLTYMECSSFLAFNTYNIDLTSGDFNDEVKEL